uniref:Uncharacterized protein n=1 Tax=Aegilops tauschii subsp. strangulata TaxID=200361 RepID=A0A453FEQ1_AEGTS
MEYLEVYCRKVDDANQTRVKQQQSVATKEAEVDMLVATLGEHKLYLKRSRQRLDCCYHPPSTKPWGPCGSCIQTLWMYLVGSCNSLPIG